MTKDIRLAAALAGAACIGGGPTATAWAQSGIAGAAAAAGPASRAVPVGPAVRAAFAGLPPGAQASVGAFLADLQLGGAWLSAAVAEEWTAPAARVAEGAERVELFLAKAERPRDAEEARFVADRLVTLAAALRERLPEDRVAPLAAAAQRALVLLPPGRQEKLRARMQAMAAALGRPLDAELFAVGKSVLPEVEAFPRPPLARLAPASAPRPRPEAPEPGGRVPVPADLPAAAAQARLRLPTGLVDARLVGAEARYAAGALAGWTLSFEARDPSAWLGRHAVVRVELDGAGARAGEERRSFNRSFAAIREIELADATERLAPYYPDFVLERASAFAKLVADSGVSPYDGASETLWTAYRVEARSSKDPGIRRWWSGLSDGLKSEPLLGVGTAEGGAKLEDAPASATAWAVISPRTGAGRGSPRWRAFERADLERRLETLRARYPIEWVSPLSDDDYRVRLKVGALRRLMKEAESLGVLASLDYVER